MTGPNRVPAGVPTGGQFAASAHAESTTTLESPGVSDDLTAALRGLVDRWASMDEQFHYTDRPAPSDFAAELEAVLASHAAAPNPVPGDAVADPEFAPSAPLTPRDVETLADCRGKFQWGYDADDINRVFGRLESARLVCVWGSFDAYGYGGSSDFVGIAVGSRTSGAFDAGRAVPADRGSWRRVHPDVWEYLRDPNSDVDPAAIPSLLTDEVYDGPDLDDLGGDGMHNLAVEMPAYDDMDEDDD